VILEAAVQKLSDRDNKEKDELRNLSFIHWDLTNEASSEFLGFLGEFANNPKLFPDFVYMTMATKFFFTMTVEDSADQVLERIDKATMGRFTEVKCDELETIVGKEKRKALVFFGDPKMLIRGGKYFHLTKMVAMDRSANKEDPIEFLFNNDE